MATVPSTDSIYPLSASAPWRTPSARQARQVRERKRLPQSACAILSSQAHYGQKGTAAAKRVKGCTPSTGRLLPADNALPLSEFAPAGASSCCSPSAPVTAPAAPELYHALSRVIRAAAPPLTGRGTPSRLEPQSRPFSAGNSRKGVSVATVGGGGASRGKPRRVRLRPPALSAAAG